MYEDCKHWQKLTSDWLAFNGTLFAVNAIDWSVISQHTNQREFTAQWVTLTFDLAFRSAVR